MKKNDLQGEQSIAGEHVKNNQDVRSVLAKSGIRPEELPPEEDLKKLERKVKAEEKKLGKANDKLTDDSGNTDDGE